MVGQYIYICVSGGHRRSHQGELGELVNRQILCKIAPCRSGDRKLPKQKSIASGGAGAYAVGGEGWTAIGLKQK